MFRIVLGLLLIGLAVVTLVFTTNTGNPPVSTWMEQLHCRPNESFLQIKGSPTRDADGSYSTPVSFYCEAKSGTAQRDITLPVVLTIIGTFIVPFLFGMLFIFWGAFGLAGRAVKTVTSAVFDLNNANMIQMRGQPRVIVKNGTLNDLDPSSRASIEKFLGSIGQSLPANFDTPNTGTTDFSDKLRELQEAYEQGLITEEEYQTARQRVLDNL